MIVCRWRTIRKLEDKNNECLLAVALLANYTCDSFYSKLDVCMYYTNVLFRERKRW